MSALGQVHLLVLNQVVSRVVTFVLNILIARAVGPDLWGVASVNLYLLYTIALFLSRDGIRRAAARHFVEPNYDDSAGPPMPAVPTSHIAIINQSWKSVAACVVCGSVAYGWLAFAVPDFASLPSAAVRTDAERTYTTALAIVAAAAVIETLSEPIYVLALCHRTFVMTRVRIETAGVIARCLVSYVWVCVDWRSAIGLSRSDDATAPPSVLLAFAVSYLVYAITVSALYYAHFYFAVRRRRAAVANGTDTPTLRRESMGLASFRDFFPQPMRDNSFDPKPLRDLSVSFSIQSIWKLALTEGEKFLMIGVKTSLAEQGVYTLVQNLGTYVHCLRRERATELTRVAVIFAVLSGSLVTRFLFQPLEESAALDFSLLQSDATAAAVAADPNAAAVAIADRRRRAYHTLTSLLRLVSLIGLTCIAFGPGFAHVFISVLYGSAWSRTGGDASGGGSEAGTVLWVYTFFILCCAVNGLSESFLFSVSSPPQLAAYNSWLIVCTIGYAAAATAMHQFGAGAIGLVIANCINMTLRIAYAIRFTDRYFAANTPPPLPPPLLRTIAPAALTAAALIASLAATLCSFQYFDVTRRLHDAGGGVSTKLLAFAPHVTVGVACLLLVAVAVMRSEPELTARITNFIKPKLARIPVVGRLLRNA